MLKLVVESWIWYSIAITVTIARYISRLLLLKNVKNLQADDYVMLLAVCTYTVFIVTINIVSDYNSNLLPPGFDESTLTPDDIASRVYGSKMVLVVEQCQCWTIWAIKACLLLMYLRITTVMRENIAVKILCGYVAFSFVFMEIFYFAVWCRPFHDYWAVPTPNPQCNAATDHLITNAVFNISSDIFLLAIALQMIIRSYLPLKRKIILSAIFGLGIFMIVAAVLNKYYSFANPFGIEWTYWYVRESSTAMIVANLPFMWTLLRRSFKLRAFDYSPTCQPSTQYHTSRTAQGRMSSRPSNGSVSSNHGHNRHGSWTKSADHSGSGNESKHDSMDKLRRKSYRGREYDGRLDRDAMALEPWDYAHTDDGSTIDIPIPKALLAKEKNMEGSSSLV